MFTPEEVYCISDFVRLCKKTLDTHVPSCWLQGEVSNLSRPSSGHLYFSLKDDKARIRCALFRLIQKNIPLNIENGLSILVRANTTIYEARGDFQVIIEQVETLGLGNLQRAFEQLKTKLKNEGLFDEKHKKPLPSYPKNIGIVTSNTGAVIADIIHILKRRHPFAQLTIFNTVTQGEQCANELTNALSHADNNGCDVLIIARGGGSLEDLWCFNEEQTARAIFALKTPVISAVGHETDTTIADFVADVRAPTPSAAAEICSPDREQKLHLLANYRQQLQRQITQFIGQKQQQLDLLSYRIIDQSGKIAQLNLQVDEFSLRLQNALNNQLTIAKTQLNKHQYNLQLQSPKMVISQKKQQQHYLQQQLNLQIKNQLTNYQNKLTQHHTSLLMSINHSLPKAKQNLNQIATSLEHLSPIKTLSRGYSITFNTKGQAIKQTTQVNTGDLIDIRLDKGCLKAKVCDIK